MCLDPRVRVVHGRRACQRVARADGGDGGELPGAGHEDGPPAAAARGTARWTCGRKASGVRSQKLFVFKIVAKLKLKSIMIKLRFSESFNTLYGAV